MQADPLSQLRDIHLPAEPGWWPPAPGWWLVACALLVAVGILVWRLWRRWRDRAPVRQAAQLLDDLWQDYQDDRDAARYVHGCNEVLKRLFVGPLLHPEVVAASGQRWLEWLDTASESTAFTRGAGQALGERRFQPRPEVDAPALRLALNELLQRAAP